MTVPLGNAHLTNKKSVVTPKAGSSRTGNIFQGDAMLGQEKVVPHADPSKAGNFHANADRPGREPGTKIDGYAGNKVTAEVHDAGKGAVLGQRPVYTAAGKLGNEVNTTRGADGNESTAPGKFKTGKQRPETVGLKTPIANKGNAGKINETAKSLASILYPE
jgi:hypothetical protein